MPSVLSDLLERTIPRCNAALLDAAQAAASYGLNSASFGIASARAENLAAVIDELSLEILIDQAVELSMSRALRLGEDIETWARATAHAEEIVRIVTASKMIRRISALARRIAALRRSDGTIPLHNVGELLECARGALFILDAPAALADVLSTDSDRITEDSGRASWCASW